MEEMTLCQLAILFILCACMEIKYRWNCSGQFDNIDTYINLFYYCSESCWNRHTINDNYYATVLNNLIIWTYHSMNYLISLYPGSKTMHIWCFNCLVVWSPLHSFESPSQLMNPRLTGYIALSNDNECSARIPKKIIYFHNLVMLRCNNM